MIAFTERSGPALRRVMDVAPGPRLGVRISGHFATVPGVPLPMLGMAAVSEFHGEDELVIGPGGIPVFIDADVAGLLEGLVLDASTDGEGQPHFVVRRGAHAVG